MHISIAADGSLSLTKPSEFTAFDIRAADPDRVAVLAALGAHGLAAPEEDHVYVASSVVRSLAGDAADDAWETGFEGMLGYAGSKGWLDETGERIKAHIEPT